MVQRNVAVITGASSGIGRLTARRLAQEGMQVVLVGRNREALNTVAEECKEKGVDALVSVTDVAEEAEVVKMTQAVVEQFGRIDLWVNNAGVTSVGAFTDTPPEVFRRIVEVNFFGCVYGTRAALGQFMVQGRGMVINVSSVFGMVPSPFESAYVASKFAVTAFSASVRQELAMAGHKHIHVCTVLPAAIDTPIYRNAANSLGKGVRPVPPMYPPDLAARTIVRLSRRPRPQAIVGGAGWMMAFLYGLLPASVFERTFARYIAHTHFTSKDAPATTGNLFEPSIRTSVGGDWPSELSARRLRIVLGAAGGLAAFWLLRRKNHVKRTKKQRHDHG